jgi:hypothetical protein
VFYLMKRPVAQTATSNDRTTEVEIMSKETVVIYYNVLSRHLPGGTDTDPGKNLTEDSRSPGRNFNPLSPD